MARRLIDGDAMSALVAALWSGFRRCCSCCLTDANVDTETNPSSSALAVIVPTIQTSPPPGVVKSPVELRSSIILHRKRLSAGSTQPGNRRPVSGHGKLATFRLTAGDIDEELSADNDDDDDDDKNGREVKKVHLQPEFPSEQDQTVNDTTLIDRFYDFVSRYILSLIKLGKNLLSY